MTVEERLRATMAELTAVPAPDLEPAVRRRLTPATRDRHRVALRPATVGVVAVAMLLAGTVSLWPSARVAVAGFLGLVGLRVEVVPEGPAVGGELRLGRRVALRQARDGVDFQVAVPRALGTPDEVWLDEDAVPGGQVTLLWRSRRDLPPSGPHDVGALLTILPGRLDAGALSKSLWNDQTSLTSVAVGGGVGWWISGEAHALVYFDARGALRADRSRLAGDTLLWQSGQALYRLESGVPLTEALRIARSVP